MLLGLPLATLKSLVNSRKALGHLKNTGWMYGNGTVGGVKTIRVHSDIIVRRNPVYTPDVWKLIDFGSLRHLI